eukprot:538145-Heterocapsa_arctica.AAC.1
MEADLNSGNVRAYERHTYEQFVAARSVYKAHRTRRRGVQTRPMAASAKKRAANDGGRDLLDVLSDRMNRHIRLSHAAKFLDEEAARARQIGEVKEAEEHEHFRDAVLAL